MHATHALLRPCTLSALPYPRLQRLLWLVTNIPGVSKKISDGETIHEYDAPNKDNVLCDGDHDGEHRVAILLFKQMPPFEVIDYLTAPRMHFKVQDMLIKRVHQMPIADFFWYTRCKGYEMEGSAHGELTPI